MAVLGVFTKQPAELMDYDVEFTEFLAGLNDSIQSFTVDADAGITVISSALNGNVVKVWCADGVSGTSYKITVTAQTVGGRIKQVEFKIKVKEA